MNETIRVDFNKPCLMGNELSYVQEAFANRHISGDGEFTKRAQRYLEQALGVHRALLTTNCTHALEMAALLLDLQPGDEVIVPSFTFVSTANAFALRGARPVFADIRSDTLNIDERQIEAKITPRTKAIVPVHYAGVGCEMDTIMALAGYHGIPVVEDNAHGLFGKYKSRNLGTFGDLATQSFHETKNITCGEGGALLINNPKFMDRAEILREKGTNRSRFFQGMVDKYTWVDLGSSYVISDVLAAFLFAQLEMSQDIQQQRARIWHYYNVHLADWARANGVQPPTIPDYCEQPYHMYYLLLPNLAARTRFIASLREKGIYSVFHYLPLHLSEMGQMYGGQPGDCPVTEDISDRLVRLPFYNTISQQEQDSVIDAVTHFQLL
jgi:dTDP-4-amino-4,6-dideoxygalactose transaminase